MTAGALCEKCEEDKSAISRALKALEETGYVQMCSEKDAKYKNRLALTEKGKVVGQKISDEILVVLADLALVTTHEERVVFFDCLTKISNGLDEILDRREQELANGQLGSSDDE
jgi:DNA-binding MarR family transcriptional regulator